MIMVDCGKCYPCLSNKRNGWTFRMLQETKYSESSMFLTLTYEEEYLQHYGDNIPTIVKTDLQKFNKRLRTRIMDETGLAIEWFKVNKDTGELSPRYRYWGVGEYGDQGNRPHYHLIAWNIPDVWTKWDPIHHQYYSEQLEELWGKGFIHLGTVTQQSIHYVAKYTLKDIFSGPYEGTKAENPFAIMSRNPGIGQDYINERVKDYYLNTYDPYATIENGYKWPLPRFYRDQIWTTEEEN